MKLTERLIKFEEMEVENKQMEKILKRVESKPVTSQAAFYKAFSEKLLNLFMEETPSAKTKIRGLSQEIRKQFSDMLDKED